MAKTVTIMCRQPGFRRAGIAHPARAEYLASAFTAEQLAQMKAEPMLEVFEAGEDDPAPAPKGKG